MGAAQAFLTSRPSLDSRNQPDPQRGMACACSYCSFPSRYVTRGHIALPTLIRYRCDQRNVVARLLEVSEKRQVVEVSGIVYPSLAAAARVFSNGHAPNGWKMWTLHVAGVGHVLLSDLPKESSPFVVAKLQLHDPLLECTDHTHDAPTALADFIERHPDKRSLFDVLRDSATSKRKSRAKEEDDVPTKVRRTHAVSEEDEDPVEPEWVPHAAAYHEWTDENVASYIDSCIANGEVQRVFRGIRDMRRADRSKVCFYECLFALGDNMGWFWISGASLCRSSHLRARIHEFKVAHSSATPK